jgi:hypothetical protein
MVVRLILKTVIVTIKVNRIILIFQEVMRATFAYLAWRPIISRLMCSASASRTERPARSMAMCEAEKGTVPECTSEVPRVPAAYEHRGGLGGAQNKAHMKTDRAPEVNDVTASLRKFDSTVDDSSVSQPRLRVRDKTERAVNSLELEALRRFLADQYLTLKENSSGRLADYIPQLAEQKASSFGISVYTVDGRAFSFGDSEQYYSIQSCVKPLLYCLARRDLGLHAVHSRVGYEPSGKGFNSFELNQNSLPHNPLNNAGSIM